LTAREREVVQLVAEGRSNKAISALLGVSVKTTEMRRTAIMRKLETKSMAKLVRYALRTKVIEA
jgi:DNA-binding NarL/FixJ family response regulator